jgi:hypothetical protein
MTQTERAIARRRFQETTEFVDHALLDFGLKDQFESRSAEERAKCLRWVDAAVGERAQEARVSQLLDGLASGEPLRHL